MLGIDWEEFLVIIVVAVVVIGPKDMPKALRTVGRWVAQVRRVSNHFKAGIETMIREAEMQEMEEKWAAQNEKIMRDHSADASPEMEPTGAYPSHPQPQPEMSAEASAAAPAGPPTADADEPQLPFKKRK
jgi:sec-independent protein translocase protein TatB